MKSKEKHTIFFKENHAILHYHIEAPQKKKLHKKYSGHFRYVTVLAAGAHACGRLTQDGEQC